MTEPTNPTGKSNHLSKSKGTISTDNLLGKNLQSRQAAYLSDSFDDLFADLTQQDNPLEIDAWIDESLQDEAHFASPMINENLSSISMHSQWVTALKSALETGRNWLVDPLGGICFQIVLAAPASLSWNTKSDENSNTLFHFELAIRDEPENNDIAWEIEVTGYVDNDQNMSLELSLIQPDQPTAALEEIPITILYREDIFTTNTDPWGIARFVGIPRMEQGEFLIRLGVEE